MLQIKEVVRSTYTEPIPFDTQTSESDEYDFGKTVVVQEGADGTEEITRETTYIDGVESSSEVVNYKVLQNPTTQLIVKGTKLASGMVARIGSGTFVWPVPNYTYVSRWMSSYHKGADICAAYGTPIIASVRSLLPVGITAMAIMLLSTTATATARCMRICRS